MQTSEKNSSNILLFLSCGIEVSIRTRQSLFSIFKLFGCTWIGPD